MFSHSIQVCPVLNVTTSCRLAWLLVVHTNQVVDEYHDTEDNAYLNTAPMDRDISGFERQQADILAQLEPIFEKYTNLQVDTFTQSSAAHMASLAFSCACTCHITMLQDATSKPNFPCSFM